MMPPTSAAIAAADVSSWGALQVSAAMQSCAFEVACCGDPGCGCPSPAKRLLLQLWPVLTSCDGCTRRA